MNNDVSVYITYGSRADQIIALRVQTLGVVEGVKIEVSPLKPSGQCDSDAIAACDGVIAIANRCAMDERLTNDLVCARELNKPVFTAGIGQIRPDLLPRLPEWTLPDEKKRVFEALRKLADAMCELREVCR